MCGGDLGVGLDLIGKRLKAMFWGKMGWKERDTLWKCQPQRIGSGIFVLMDLLLLHGS